MQLICRLGFVVLGSFLLTWKMAHAQIVMVDLVNTVSAIAGIEGANELTTGWGIANYCD